MMRKVYIISQEAKIGNDLIAEATAQGCTEIARGVPTLLKGKVGKLPAVYEETPSEPNMEVTLEARLAALEAEVTALKKLNRTEGRSWQMGRN